MRKILIAILLLAPFAAQAKTDAEYNFCLRNIANGKYLEEWQAEIVCTQATNVAVGCAMDLVDQGYYKDLIEAVEYCMAPPTRPPPPAGSI